MPSSTHHATILVVEDEPRLVRLIESILRTADYRVLTAGTGADALEMVALEAPDLILLDLLLPGDIDGFDVCRRVREFSDVPIIMLTARTQETDKLRGFELGADDYVTKPFSAKELLARVQAVLRRSRGFTAGPARLTVGDLVIDLAAHRVTRDGEDIHLTPTEFRLLHLLMRHPGRAFGRSYLLDTIWGDQFVGERSVDNAVLRLRKKLGPLGEAIETVWGVGYRLRAPDVREGA